MNNGFIFYGSFWDAIKDLDDANRLAIYDAVCEYALTGNFPDISGVALAMFKLIKPQIDANNKRREAGRKGGFSKAEANAQQTDSKDVANPSKDVAKEKEKVKVKAKEKENIKEKRFVPPTLEEVQEYCKEKQLNVEPKQFLDYFTTSNWVDSKGQKVKNWKQKLLTWNSFRSSRASPQKQNSFSKGIMQQDYDMDAIERAILT